ncbi:hypothetical protein GOP47_0013099 [Adiantum capillus-veneris]|uniref:Uncharacterized protein n=1 Tax=Adiantum capillus-veneris TaxID=13818 RepID=A0A9D4UTB5_ADICA|nr:hypothetical protein GOP47_0013099 [Adiantum capillus-veneris]
MVGVEALAHRLVQLQTQTIADVFPVVLKQIDSSLEVKRQELQLLSGDICSLVDASVALILNVSYVVKKALEDILLLPGSDCSADLIISSAELSTMPNGSNSKSQTNYNASLHQEFTKFKQKVTIDAGEKLVLTETLGGHVDSIQRLLSECLSTNLPM